MEILISIMKLLVTGGLGFIGSNFISRILALADIAWKPNDNEMRNTLFENYDWKKWNLESKI